MISRSSGGKTHIGQKGAKGGDGWLWEEPLGLPEADNQFSPRRRSHADLCPHAPQHRSPWPRKLGAQRAGGQKMRSLKALGSWPHRPLFSSLRTLGSA